MVGDRRCRGRNRYDYFGMVVELDVVLGGEVIPLS